MDASDSNSGRLLLGKFHQLRFGGVFTASNEFAWGVRTTWTDFEEFARINFPDVVGLHIVGKEVFTLIVDMAYYHFICFASKTTHDNLVRFLRGIRAIHTDEVSLLISLFLFTFNHDTNSLRKLFQNLKTEATSIRI